MAALQPHTLWSMSKSFTGLLATLKKEGEHGVGFKYKTVDTEAIDWLLQRVTGKSLSALMSERLWSRIGAQDDDYVWVDPIGTQITSVGFSATLRDLGRVGQMMPTSRVTSTRAPSPPSLPQCALSERRAISTSALFAARAGAG
jgi:CubicO group peptidase (beta-lactamase class C family)